MSVDICNISQDFCKMSELYASVLCFRGVLHIRDFEKIRQNIAVVHMHASEFYSSFSELKLLFDAREKMQQKQVNK